VIFAVEVFILEADFLREVVVFLVRVLRGVAGVAAVEDLRGINVNSFGLLHYTSKRVDKISIVTKLL